MLVNELTFEDINQLKSLHTMVSQAPLPIINATKTTILVIGNARAGKSSIINMLIDENEVRRPVIGVRAGKAQTELPEIFSDKINSNILYFDSHGFEDTRPNKKAALSLIMQSVVHNHRINGLLIMIDARSFSDNAMALLKLLSTLNQLLKEGAQIENSCVFGITRVSPEPALGVTPSRESIYSLGSLDTILKDLHQGFQEYLDEEMELLKSNPQYDNANELTLSKYAHELISKMRITSLLIRAIQANRVVLVYDTPEKKIQTCEQLRHQFGLLSNESFINESLNFDTYDADRTLFMNKILNKSTHFLSVLEQEETLIKQRHYMLHSDMVESSEQRVVELDEEIRQKETELSKIDSRETAAESYWTDSKSVVPNEHQWSEYADGGGVGTGEAKFFYQCNAPISRVELIGGRHFNYLKTFWNTEEPLGMNLWRALLIAPLRVMTAGVSELYILGAPALLDSYKFTHMTLNGKNTYIDRPNWEVDIALPDQIGPTSSVFSVTCQSMTMAGLDCHDRKPTVKIYVPICYMPGNPERIVNLKKSLVTLRQQRQETGSIIQYSKEAIEHVGTSHEIHEQLVIDKKSMLRQSGDELKIIGIQIEQQRELITLIHYVFNVLPIPLHENITKFIQLWDNRVSSLRLIGSPQDNSVENVSETAACTAQKILSSTFKNSIYALFRQNQHFTIQQSEKALTIQRTQPVKEYNATFFNNAKQKFEQLMSTHPEYSLKKHSEEQWSIEGETPSIAKLHDEFELIASEKRLANLRSACTIS